MSSPRLFRPVLAALLGATLLHAAPQEYWVAPAGSDERGQGTRSSPWQTLAGARDHLRESAAITGMEDDLIVNLLPGEYLVSKPVFFGGTDSGRNGHAIIYRTAGAPGSAILLGAVRVTGWRSLDHPGAAEPRESASRPGAPATTGPTHENGGIWTAQLPPGSHFSTLYEGQRRARVARIPNYAPDARYPGYDGGYFHSTAGKAQEITYRPEDLGADFHFQTGAVLWWWGHEGKRNWGMSVCPITGVDPVKHTIAFAGGLSAASSDERFFLQGTPDLLDAPGEFILDPATGRLRYWPMGGDPRRIAIFAPRVQEILHLENAHDLRFVGLAFRGTDYVADAVTTVGEPRAAVFARNASRVEIRDCHFYQLGNQAIRLIDACQDDTIRGCLIERTGEGGIQIYNSQPRAAHPNAASRGHLVTDCLIHDFQEVRVSTHWCGVQLFSVESSEVSHCEIYHSGRYAISLRGNYSTQVESRYLSANYPSRSDVFRYLKLHDCGGDSGDMGALHAAHCNPTDGPNRNTWEQITIRDVRAHPSMDDVPPDGVFLDHPHSCENQILRNIEVSDVEGLPFRTNHNPEQTLDNVSWLPGFTRRGMEYPAIGLTPAFPAAYR